MRLVRNQIMTYAIARIVYISTSGHFVVFRGQWNQKYLLSSTLYLTSNASRSAMLSLAQHQHMSGVIMLPLATTTHSTKHIWLGT